MMVFILAKGSFNKEKERVTFPTTAAKVWSAVVELEETSMFGSVQIIDAEGIARSLLGRISLDDLLNEAGMEKLNRMSGILDGMNAEEQKIFRGALIVEHAEDLDSVLRVVSSLDQYELIDEVTTDREMGEWLVKKGFLDVDIPETLRPLLDYPLIGAQYYRSHPGTYTQDGYVRPRIAAPTLENTEKFTILLTFHTLNGEHRLPLPASDAKLEQSKEALGVDEFAQASISTVQYIPADLEELIPLDAISVEEANELALWLQQMEQEDSGLMKYRAVLEVEQPDTFSQAVTIAMDIEDYELVPEDMDEYGKQVLRRVGADNELLDVIDGYMNFAQLGQDFLAEDGGRRTEFGLVRRLSAPFPSQEEIGQMMC